MSSNLNDMLDQLGTAEAAEAVVRPREALPDLEAHNPTVRWMVHLGAPLIASMIAHIFLFVALGLARWDLGGPHATTEYSAGITDAEPVDEGFKWPNEKPEEKSEAPDEWPDSVASLDQLQQPQTPDASVNSLPQAGGFGDLGSLGTSGVIGIGSGMGEGGGRGGAGEGFGARGGATIFNFSADGSRFVYVLDFSGSLVVTVDDLKRELKRSVASLQSSNEFNVILFYETAANKQMVDAYQSQLAQANPQMKQGFFDWIMKKAPNGGTAPLEALRRALAMKPDAIFFFSDGGFENEVVSQITKANSRKTPINCLVFDEILINDRSGLPKVTEGAKRMQKLAEENRGKTKIVTGKDIEKGAKGAK